MNGKYLPCPGKVLPGSEKRGDRVNNDVLVAFSVFQMTFLALDIFIMTKTDRNIARKGEYTWFCVLICTHIAYLLLNTVWTLSEYNVLRLPRQSMMVVCTASMWTVMNCAASFFLFVVERLQLKRLQSGAGIWLRQIPAVFFTLLIAATPWTGWVFSLSEEGYFIHGPMYLPTMLAASIYLLTVAVVAVTNLFRQKTRVQRRANATLLASVLIIISFIVADGLLSKASILPAAIFSVITGIFITMQEANINSDALTGMNNRRKAEEYLTDRVRNVSDKKPLYLYMGDLNGFKKINDTYGHAVGDEALILCSQALKRAIGRYNGFAARYGGDEFLLSWQPDKGVDPDPEQLILDVNANLRELGQGKPYELVMTMGYALCSNPKELLINYIRQADGMLYQRKKAAGVGR